MADPRVDGDGWRLPESAKPPLVSELVERIDEALATARASEAAVMTVGAAALDAAEQARRAAELAERASAALSERPGSVPPRPRLVPSANGDDDLRSFAARADRVAARLRELERLPIVASATR
jgi:plasmid stabilization system protein ParE